MDDKGGVQSARLYLCFSVFFSLSIFTNSPSKRWRWIWCSAAEIWSTCRFLARALFLSLYATWVCSCVPVSNRNIYSIPHQTKRKNEDVEEKEEENSQQSLLYEWFFFSVCDNFAISFGFLLPLLACLLGLSVFVIVFLCRRLFSLASIFPFYFLSFFFISCWIFILSAVVHVLFISFCLPVNVANERFACVMLG